MRPRFYTLCADLASFLAVLCGAIRLQIFYWTDSEIRESLKVNFNFSLVSQTRMSSD